MATDFCCQSHHCCQRERLKMTEECYGLSSNEYDAIFVGGETNIKENGKGQCRKSFIQAASPKKQMLTHTGEKRHKCTQCNYATNQTGHLKSHIQTHTGEKNHTCEQCNKSFNQSSTLKTHNILHTGEKPQKCRLCNFSFITAGNLKQHMKRVHSDKI